MSENGRPETVGERLRRLRTDAGMSQREISEPGVSYAYISRIEANTRHPSVKALRVLARKLGVTPEYLETGSEATTTDALAAEAVATCGAAVVLTVGPDGQVHASWHRMYADDEEYAAAGLGSGLSDERQAEAGTLTAVLQQVLAHEAEADKRDHEILQAHRQLRTADSEGTGGRPRRVPEGAAASV